MRRSFRSTRESWAKRTSGLHRQVVAYPVPTFYVLAFGISWLGYLPGFARAWGMPLFQSRLWLASLILPALGPAVAAGMTDRLTGGASGGWSRLWASWTLRVAWPWWLVALLLPAAEMAAANQISGTVWPERRGAEAGLSLMGVGVVSLMSLGANPWEEVGWRGFALMRLEKRYRPLTASLIVGVLWALWHIPLFLLPGGPMSMAAMPFWVWALGCVAKSVVLAWLYNSTSQSLGVVTVAHLSSNIFGAVLGVRSFGVLSAVEGTAAVAVIALNGAGLGLRKEDSAARLE